MEPYQNYYTTNSCQVVNNVNSYVESINDYIVHDGLNNNTNFIYGTSYNFDIQIIPNTNLYNNYISDFQTSNLDYKNNDIIDTNNIIDYNNIIYNNNIIDTTGYKTSNQTNNYINTNTSFREAVTRQIIIF